MCAGRWNGGKATSPLDWPGMQKGVVVATLLMLMMLLLLLLMPSISISDVMWMLTRERDDAAIFFKGGCVRACGRARKDRCDDCDKLVAARRWTAERRGRDTKVAANSRWMDEVGRLPQGLG